MEGGICVVGIMMFLGAGRLDMETAQAGCLLGGVRSAGLLGGGVLTGPPGHFPLSAFTSVLLLETNSPLSKFWILFSLMEWSKASNASVPWNLKPSLLSR